MATKWKNKIILVVWLVLLGFGLTGVFSLNFGDNDYLRNDYFKTEQFRSELDQFVYYLNLFELNYISKEEAKKQIIVTADEIDEHRYRYGDLPDQIINIKAQYEDRITEAKQMGNQEIAEMYASERDKKIQDITNNFKSDEHIKTKIIKEKEGKLDEYYSALENRRGNFERLKSNFKYYLKDVNTDKVYSNFNLVYGDLDQLISKNNMMFIANYPNENGYLSDNMNYNDLGYVKDLMFEATNNNQEKNFEGKIAVPKATNTKSSIQLNYENYTQKQKIYLIYLGISALALGASIVLYKKFSIAQLIGGEKARAYYQRVPLDVAITVFLISALCTLTAISNSIFIHYYYQYRLLYIIEYIITNTVFASVLVGITFFQGKILFLRLQKKDELGQEWKKCFIYRAKQDINKAFLNRSVATQVILLLAVVFILGFGAVFGFLGNEELLVIYLVVLLLIGVPLLFLIVRLTSYFNQIINNTQGLVEGNTGEDLPLRGRSILAKLAANINTLKYGVTASRREQAKSERLKTELITNVSHDLRTPLTSIITYVELLKSSELKDEDRESYIEIIDRKSKRLKVLIEDLFEASKMASGSIELHQAQVDIVQLLQQALAEYNEKMLDSTLQFRITKPDNPVYVKVDGQKIWRVFDNLIGNILKYSHENTRVYISISVLEEQGKVKIIFKNIAKYELGQDTDELFERFKRGDKSRHTEGSGLGLAIAKSIVDLHGGNLDIALDGDLFKVTVVLDTI